jgi:hypothetical protein
MKSRLIQFLNHLQIGQNSFEISVGWSTGTIFNLNKGIRSDKLALLAMKHPELNLRWLLLGEGEMLTQPEDAMMKNPTLDFVIRHLASENEKLQAKIDDLNTECKELRNERDDLIERNHELEKTLARKGEIASVVGGFSDANVG